MTFHHSGLLKLYLVFQLGEKTSQNFVGKSQFFRLQPDIEKDGLLIWSYQTTDMLSNEARNNDHPPFGTGVKPQLWGVDCMNLK